MIGRSPRRDRAEHIGVIAIPKRIPQRRRLQPLVERIVRVRQLIPVRTINRRSVGPEGRHRNIGHRLIVENPAHAHHSVREIVPITDLPPPQSGLGFGRSHIEFRNRCERPEFPDSDRGFALCP